MDLREALTAEDDVLETLTALIHLAAALVGAFALARPRDGVRLPLHWIIPPLALFMALEETSLPERLAGGGVSLWGEYIDAPHDLLTALLVGLKDGIASAFAVAVVALAVAVAAVLLLRRRAPRLLAAVPRHPGWPLLLLALASLGAAFGLDAVRTVTDHPKFFGLTLAEELLELAAAALLLVAAARGR